MIVDFKMDAFLEQLQERTAQVDQQLLDTLLSFTDCANFKQFIKDYRNSYE